jgi:hypothetical protein
LDKESDGEELKPIYIEDSIYYQAALYLRGKIREFNPESKVPDDKPEKMQKWSNDMRMIIDVDKRGTDKLKAILEYIFKNDDFWRAVVQSPQGLRKNWDKIWAQMIARQNKPTGQKQTRADKINSNIEEWLKGEEI